MSSIYIGSRREVFWDDSLIEISRTTAELTLHKPRIENIVFIHDAPWEGDGCNSYSIIKIGDVCQSCPHKNMSICRISISVFKLDVLQWCTKGNTECTCFPQRETFKKIPVLWFHCIRFLCWGGRSLLPGEASLLP